jgi:hypothetical protein
MSARVDRGPKHIVILALDRFDDLRVCVDSFGDLQHGQPEFFAACPQASADAASCHYHGDQPGL